jgi:hypothetical protein
VADRHLRPSSPLASQLTSVLVQLAPKAAPSAADASATRWVPTAPSAFCGFGAVASSAVPAGGGTTRTVGAGGAVRRARRGWTSRSRTGTRRRTGAGSSDDVHIAGSTERSSPSDWRSLGKAGVTVVIADTTLGLGRDEWSQAGGVCTSRHAQASGDYPLDK